MPRTTIMTDRQEPVVEPAASALSPFGHRIFRLVWMATLASSFGGMIQGVGAAWMMVALGGSAQMVTLVQASITLPIVVLALVAGALLGGLMAWRGNLLGPVVGHVLVNAVNLRRLASRSGDSARLPGDSEQSGREI